MYARESGQERRTTPWSMRSNESAVNHKCHEAPFRRQIKPQLFPSVSLVPIKSIEKFSQGLVWIKAGFSLSKPTAPSHFIPSDTRHCQGHCCSRPWATSKDLPVASEVLPLADQAADRDGSVPPSSSFSTLQLLGGRAAGLKTRRGSIAKG